MLILLFILAGSEDPVPDCSKENYSVLAGLLPNKYALGKQEKMSHL